MSDLKNLINTLNDLEGIAKDAPSKTPRRWEWTKNIQGYGIGQIPSSGLGLATPIGDFRCSKQETVERGWAYIAGRRENNQSPTN